jgi:hypothetical protein
MSINNKKLCFEKIQKNSQEDEVEVYLKKNTDNLIVKIDDLVICKSRQKLLNEELKEKNISGGVYYLYEDNENQKKSLINKKSRNEKIADKTFSIFDIEYSGVTIKGLPLYEVIPYKIEQYENINEVNEDEEEDEYENEF